MVNEETVGERLDKATGLMGEARIILEKLEKRQEMIRASYLGEMSEFECYEVALKKALEAVNILQDNVPNDSNKIDIAKLVVADVQKVIDEKKTPVVEKPVVEEKKELVVEEYAMISKAPEMPVKKFKRKYVKKKEVN